MVIEPGNPFLAHEPILKHSMTAKHVMDFFSKLKMNGDHMHCLDYKYFSLES